MQGFYQLYVVTSTDENPDVTNILSLSSSYANLLLDLNLSPNLLGSGAKQ